MIAMADLPEPVAVIGGTGDLGQGFCKFLLHHGIETIIGSRKEEKAKRITGELTSDDTEPLAEGLQNEDAAEKAEMVILAIPFWGHEHILPGLKEHVEDKVVLDTTAPLDDDDPTSYDEPDAGSAGLHVKDLLGDAPKLVSGFHTISAHSLENPEDKPEADVFYCGEDEEAKEVIAELIDRLELSGHDAGDLERSRTLERLTPMVIHFNMDYGKRDIGLKLAGV
jgi:NADPH-dependent F420 reductase